jgi:tRNA(fMet)-specific endonuclease VapC
VRFLLDTSVLIPFRDGDRDAQDLVATLGEFVFASVVSQVELEGGVFRDPATSHERKMGLEQMFHGIEILPFTRTEGKRYGQIVAMAGYSRRKILDRMIAAQALVANATLVTFNPDDFADIPDLEVYPL